MGNGLGLLVAVLLCCLLLKNGEEESLEAGTSLIRSIVSVTDGLGSRQAFWSIRILDEASAAYSLLRDGSSVRSRGPSSVSFFFPLHGEGIGRGDYGTIFVSASYFSASRDDGRRE